MGLKVGGVGLRDEGGVPFPPGSRRGLGVSLRSGNGSGSVP